VSSKFFATVAEFLASRGQPKKHENNTYKLLKMIKPCVFELLGRERKDILE